MRTVKLSLTVIEDDGINVRTETVEFVSLEGNSKELLSKVEMKMRQLELLGWSK